MIGFLAKALIERPTPRLPLEISSSRTMQRISRDVFHAAFRETQYLDPGRMQEIAERRLQYIIWRAKKIPFFSKHLSGVFSADAFLKIPPVTKKEMRVRFEQNELVNRTLAEYAVWQHTSGSTGVPFHFFLDANMFARRAAVYRRMYDWAGRAPEDAVVCLMPKLHPGLEGEYEFYPCVDPADIEKKFASIHKILSGRRIILQSRASHLIRLAQLLEEKNITYDFKSAISYTEQLFPEARAYIERVLGAPVFDYYACNEITAIGQECSEHSGFHVNSEWVHVEILDDQHKPVRLGQAGNIVVTSFDNEVMPFIRYEIGDRGWWLPAECRCGRGLPLLRVEGRKANVFRLPDGATGYFASLAWPIASRVDKIFQYKVVRYSADRFEILIVPTSRFTDADRNFILGKFRDYVGNARISFRTVEQIACAPGGKPYAFVNLSPE